MLPKAPQSGNTSSDKFRILIVEDDVAIGRLLTANLTKAGFSCRHAPDGGLGLAAFHEFKPHLVLLDLMMPVLDGRQLCTKIRESSTVPVIMLTAMDSDEDQMQGLKLGADDYVTKPFHPNLLVARVMSHLRRVYRYNEAGTAGGTAAGGTAPTGATTNRTATKGAAQGAAEGARIPMGWGMCEACGYMGPQSKFEVQDGAGRRVLQCPVCKQENRVTISMG